MSPAIVGEPAAADAQRLSALARLELLCDDGSLRVLRSGVASTRMGDKGRPGDGVVGAAGEVGGRPVFCYAQDSRVSGGSLGEAHADTIVRVMELAGKARAPVVGFVDSGGARVQEGMAALGGYGRIFNANVALSGQVPQISVVSGTAAGGGSYSPALTDFLVMTEDTSMFLTGPAVVRAAVGEEVTATELGGTRVHERSGVCQFVARSDPDAVALCRELLSYLPQNAAQRPPRASPMASPGGADPSAVVPSEARRVYDIRDVVRAVADDGALLEMAPRWARNVVTAFARIDGRPVGVVANQPRHLGGCLDADAGQKASRFVHTCNTYGLPLVVLVDTPGFIPGSSQEAAGVIRHGAKLLRAFAEATVPRVTVVLRKAYGGAYITMNSKDLGADLVFAWPSAEIGVMAAQQAVGLVNRRELEATDDGDHGARRDELAEAYTDTHLRAEVAAAQGFVDEVIEPRETRGRLLWALASLDGRVREESPGAGNIDL
jgi:acetyl-CoA carboxylase carboxyltransferase component